VATGASPQKLFVPGEDEFWGRGVSYSAISHAPFFHGRDVAVVGHGERALQAVVELSHLAHKVYLIAGNETWMKHPLGPIINTLKNVSVFTHWTVERIVGDQFVTGIDLTIWWNAMNMGISSLTSKDAPVFLVCLLRVM